MNSIGSSSPLVTIVTPSYNMAEFLPHTIASVFSQDYPNIEYIVIDGASTDGTLEILDRHKGPKYQEVPHLLPSNSLLRLI